MEKKPKDQIRQYGQIAALGLAGIGAHVLYKRGGFVKPRTESSYIQQVFHTKLEGKATPGILGASHVRDLYERSGVSMFSHLGRLFPMDANLIQQIAKTSSAGMLHELEMNFVSRVIKRMNRPYYEMYRDKPEELLQTFKTMVDEGLTSTLQHPQNKILTSILAEEVRYLDKSKNEFIIPQQPRTGTIGEYLRQKHNLYNEQVGSMTRVPEETDVQRRLRQMIGEQSQRQIPRGAVLTIAEPPRIVDPADRFVPIGELQNRYSSTRGNLPQFLSELSMTSADAEAKEFFKSLDILLRSELQTINITPNITYTLRRGGMNLLEGVAEIGFTGKPPLKLSIPISSGHVVTIGTSKWVLHPIKDYPSMLPSMEMAQGRNAYDLALGNITKRFRALYWNTYGAGQPARAQQMLDNLITSAFRATRQLYTSQPLATILAQHQNLDVARMIETGRFNEDLVPKRMVQDRVLSMQRLKTFITRSKGKPRLPSQYMVIDFETFPSTKNPHSVTIMVVRNGKIIDMFTKNINPQSPEFAKGMPYIYPENDLKLSFQGMSRAQIRAKLEGASGGQNSFNVVRREMMTFVRQHIGPGERIPFVAFGSNFEKDIIRRHFTELQSVLSDWIDPLDIHRALTPGVTSVSISQQNVGMRMGLIERDPVTKSYRLSRSFIEELRRRPHLLRILETKGGKEGQAFVQKLRMATTEAALDALALHTATTDVIVANEILVKTMWEIGANSAKINSELSTKLYRARRCVGISDPALSAHLAMGAAGETYFAGSAATMLAGKTPTYNVKELLPLLWPGIDPHRPLLQRFTGGQLLHSAYPAIVTEKYKQIADTYGTLFQSLTVGLGRSPITANGASLINVQAADKMSMLGFSYTRAIPTNKQVKFHAAIADLMAELEATPPEQHASIISKRNKDIQKQLARHSKIPGWIPGGTTFAQDPDMRYVTKGTLFSQLEGIAFNKPGEEVLLTFRTVDRPGFRQQPIKFFAGTHKGVANLAKGLPFDAILHGNIGKRGRADATVGHINRVAENLQLLYQNTGIRQSPEFRILIQEFVEEVNARGGIRLQPHYGRTLQFIDAFSDKDLSYVDKELITANLEEFARKDWATFMRKYSNRIFLLRTKFGTQWALTSPVIPYWTPDTIEQYLASEYRISTGGKSTWAKLPKARKKKFREALERETLEFMRIDRLGQDLQETERRALSKIRPGALRVVQKYGGEFLQIVTLSASRAFEHGEVYAKGTMVKIPYLDSLVATGEIAKHIMTQHTPAQRALQEYYEMAHNTLMYGHPPPGGYPVKSAMDIKFPTEKKDLSELERIVGRRTTIYIPEANRYYNVDRGVPVDLMGPDGELRPGLTKEVVPPGRWMHADDISSLYGTNPRFMEFELGKYKSYIPIPGVQQVAGATAPPVKLSTGDVYTIVPKEILTYTNMKRTLDAYKRAEAAHDGKLMERELQKFRRLERDYRQEVLFNRSAFMDRMNPSIPGVQGKVNALYLPGIEGIIGQQNKHLVAGFGVQKVSVTSMGDSYFDTAMESHRLPSGEYIGASGRKYRSKTEFKSALLKSGGPDSELLTMSIIRRPAESGKAWLETFVQVTRGERTGIGMQHREALLTHYDPDGDLAAMVFPEEREQHIRQLQRERLRDRKLHRNLFERVRRLQSNILEYDRIEEGSVKTELRNAIKSEVGEFRELSGKMHMDIYNGGVWARAPKEQTRHMAGRRLIRLGLGDEMKFMPMRNLQRFDPELGMDIVKSLSTTAEEEYAGYVAQTLTKSATPFAYTPGHMARLALRASGDPNATQIGDALDTFYGKVTALKKFSGREAEDLVHALIRPDLPSSTKVMEDLGAKFMPDLPSAEITKIADIVRKLRMQLGTRQASNLIRGMIRSTPLTAEMLQLYGEGPPPEFKIPGPKFFGENVIGKLKSGNASMAKMGAILGIGAAAVLLKGEDLSTAQGYPSLNLHQVRFPARTHIRRMDRPRTQVSKFTSYQIGPGIVPSDYAVTTDRRTDLRNSR